jgi:hypothetical protein
VPDRNGARKRRPVDVLFGDRSSAYTDYVIEAPQPVTTVTPPPPALVLFTTPEPLTPHVVPPIEQPPPNPAPAAVQSKLPVTQPTSTPEPLPESKSTATQDRISRMYDEVRGQLGTSQGVARECMELLLEARIAYTEGDFARAEFYTESVEARLAQSTLSQQSARRPIVWIIGLWNVVMLVTAGAVLIGSYVFFNPTLFGIANTTQIVLVLRTGACGAIGAALGVMLSLVRSLSHREYDPANELGYFAKALVGAGLGGMLSIIFQLIAVLGGGIPDLVLMIHVFTYLLASLVGFGLDTLVEFFSSFRN